MATSLYVPVAYITVLVTALAIFSKIYRGRKLAEKKAFELWFPSHPSRDLYITLLSSPEKQPENLLKSALLIRAVEDVKRIWRIRDDSSALRDLHQRGLIGDDTMARFGVAEKELEAEVLDVIQEANSFRQGWGQIIFATATEMAQAEKTREGVINVHKLRAREEKRIILRKKYLGNNGSIAGPGPSSAPKAAIAPASTSEATATPAGSETTSASPAALSTPQKSKDTSTSAPASETTSRSVSPGGAAPTTPAAAAATAGTPTPGSTKSSAKKKKGKK